MLSLYSSSICLKDTLSKELPLVTDDGDFVLSYTRSCYDKVGPPTMTVGIYDGHAFLITDINKVTNNYTCGERLARFTPDA